MIDIIFIMILIFLYYLICICIYILYNNQKNKRINKNLQRINKEVYEIMEYEMSNLKKDNILDDKNMKRINQILKSKSYQKHIIKYLLRKENKKDIIDFMKKTKLIDVVLNQDEEDECDKAYKIYIIGELNIQNQYGYLIKNIDNNSVYIQINILKSLAKLGNKEYFINGLKMTINSSSLIHEKLLADIIYTFYKNDKSINEYLNYELDKNNNEFNKIIINHFINTKYENASEDIYKLLIKNNSDKEVKITCIKYFSNIKYLKSKDILVTLLSDKNWEIRAISASALKKYKSKDVIENLQKSIKDSDWYVRQNSARSLYYLVNEKDKLQSIINGEDKYASDSIVSILSEEYENEYVIAMKENNNIADFIDKCVGNLV